MPGSASPSASTSAAMVDAVPISLQWPRDGIGGALELVVLRRGSSGRRGRRRCTSRGRCPRRAAGPGTTPAFIGPAGDHDRRARRRWRRPSAAPAPSCRNRRAARPRRADRRGCDSSTSIAMRLRKSIVVGFIRFSPSEIVGNSSGRPPAASTPRLTASASPRKCRLQLTSSDHELQMPTTGRPSRADGGDALAAHRGAVDQPARRRAGRTSGRCGGPGGRLPSVVESGSPMVLPGVRVRRA